MPTIYNTNYEFINFTGNVPLQFYAKKTVEANKTTYSIQPIAPDSKIIRWLQAHFAFINKIVLAILTPSIVKDPNCLILKDLKVIPNGSGTSNLDNINKFITEDESGFFEDFKGSVNTIFPEHLFTITHTYGTKYDLSIYMPFVEKQPERVLEDFYSSCFLACPSVSEITVHPLNQYLARLSTIDAGGPRRQFISDLFDSLLLKATQNQTSMLKFESTVAGCLPVITGDSISEEEEKLYKTIGKIMHICHLSNETLKIGQIFDPAVFDVIAAIKPHMANCDIEDLSDNEIVTLYATLKKRDENQSLKKLIEFYNLQKPSHNYGFLGRIYSYAANTEAQLREMLTYAYDYAGEERPEALDGEPSKETLVLHFDTIKDAIRKQIVDYARDDKTLPAALKMGQFISSGSNSANLMTSIQGVFSKETVLYAINCYGPIKGFLTKWINESSEEAVRTFLKAATGSKTIGQSTSIYINVMQQSDRLPEYHTCSYQVDIPKYPSYEIFKKKLEQSFDSAAGTGFQFM